MSKKFKITLLVRTIGYSAFFCGIFILLLVFGPLIQAEASYRIDQAFGVKRTAANVANLPVNEPSPSAGASSSPTSGFGEIEAKTNLIYPTSTEFGLVIPKINAAADIIDNVDPTNEKAYVKALTKGVARAAGTTLPGEVGNMYLFSHSTDAPWNVVRYNAVFYLLRELEAGDDVIIFYKGRRYDYQVFDKQVVSPNDTTLLTNKYDQPVLTMQTCDPPGTLLKRLIVRARLKVS